MAITQITYARLHNLGNYENERFEVVVTVEEGDVAGAFAEARYATDAARSAAQIEREEQAEQHRLRMEQERQRKIDERLAAQRAQEQARKAQHTDDDWL